MLFRYALRELRNSPRFSLLFIANLTLGLLGFISLDALKRSFEDRLQGSARELLGADMSISARRQLKPEELESARKLMPRSVEDQKVMTLYSMVAHNDQSSLVELRAVKEGYPYYGKIRLRQSGIYDGQSSLPLKDQPKAWVAPEILIQLDASVGSTLRIGSQDFTIADVIEEDAATTLGANAMAPRVYVGLDQLGKAGLVQSGSTLWDAHLFRLPPDTDVASLEVSLKEVLRDPGIRIKTYKEAGQDDGRMLGYLSDYLGLISLVALVLAGIGAAYLFRDYMERKTTAIATLVSLGLTHNRAFLLCLIELSTLGFLSALSACLLSAPFIPLALRFFRTFSPVPLEASLPLQSWLLCILLGIFGALFICLPLLLRLRFLNPSLLFQEQSSENDVFSARNLLGYIPGLVGFYLLSVWQAHSWVIGSIFFGIFFGIVAVLAATSWIFIRQVKRLKRHSSLPIRFASLNLRSHPISTMSAFIALGIGSSLINLIPQIQNSLQSELEKPNGEVLPSLFLFDIQEDQVDGLQGLLQGVGSFRASPMIMGRLTQVNGQAFQRLPDAESDTRENQREQNTRNRGVNLSYRDQLSSSERVTEGQFFSKPYDFASNAPAEVSLETNYANRLGLKVGDRLTFDVQGLPVEGVVTSLRSVKWNSFQPNFFILLQPGAIDDAPKTFLMSLPDMPLEKKMGLQKTIVQTYPNISIIDVSKLVAKINEVISQMSLVLVVMGWLTVFTGLFVVFSIAQQQALARRWDHNLMKVLGAPFSLLVKASIIEFLSLSLAASVLGSLLGILGSFILAKGIFRGVWQPSLSLPLGLSLTLMLICLLTAWAATRRILRSQPSLVVEV